MEDSRLVMRSDEPRGRGSGCGRDGVGDGEGAKGEAGGGDQAQRCEGGRAEWAQNQNQDQNRADGKRQRCLPGRLASLHCVVLPLCCLPSRPLEIHRASESRK
ncbi:uncharacterized protein PSANT_05454 [Moesziomyces antarcticus]|uniref:Uncharacterized protein n=1 Tax=Pseudozyma antarctica TaxID=84753 RepID=A0A5C3FU40_PSEA2|nr:uncharacterized protein PSANT_05454 [Moesziomyces antarcticus]